VLIYGADLGANLSGANLYKTNLEVSNLKLIYRGADLTLIYMVLI
jgi:uncharacterized protein YjbI with pentapeptide repeats